MDTITIIYRSSVKHIFSNKFTGIFTGGYDRYAYHISSEKNKINAYKLGFDINQFNVKADFNWYASPEHQIDFGTSTIRYKLNPGNFEPVGKESLIVADEVATETGTGKRHLPVGEMEYHTRTIHTGRRPVFILSKPGAVHYKYLRTGGS